MRLKDKVAVITGVRRGLGLATAQLFINEGAVVIGLSKNMLEKDIQEKLFQKPDRAFFEAIDITDAAAVKEFALNIEQKFGYINILVNNAGINSMGNIEEVSEEEFSRTMAVNVYGTFLVTKYLIPLMKKNINGGSIVNVSSNIGVVGMSGRIAYTTSKGAVINFTRSMAMDYAKYNIRVNTIAPGAINTDMVIEFFKNYPKEFREKVCAMHALNRLAEPIEIANAILFLASDESSYVTGSVMAVDGGYTCGK